jgi:hypothetical protein
MLRNCIYEGDRFDNNPAAKLGCDRPNRKAAVICPEFPLGEFFRFGQFPNSANLLEAAHLDSIVPVGWPLRSAASRAAVKRTPPGTQPPPARADRGCPW